MMQEQEIIDFVVPWVDSNDPDWRRQKDLYTSQFFSRDSAQKGNREERFRDWDQFKYWFRGVEKFTPWVNRVYLITCGHLPEWLNTDHPKLRIINHDEIIPKEYLPVFSSHPIDLCACRIKNLSEQFVYFNDDTFIISPLEKTAFFRNHLPCLKVEIRDLASFPVDFFWKCTLLKNLEVINRNFTCREVLQKHWRKLIHPVYGIKQNIKTIISLPLQKKGFYGFHPRHAPNPYLKSVCGEVWAKEMQELLHTCSHRFRYYDDVNQYIFLWWQICKGYFVPIQTKKLYGIVTTAGDVDKICMRLINQQTSMLCINDSEIAEDSFREKKEKINRAFDLLFSQKSTFEK